MIKDEKDIDFAQFESKFRGSLDSWFDYIKLKDSEKIKTLAQTYSKAKNKEELMKILKLGITSIPSELNSESIDADHLKTYNEIILNVEIFKAIESIKDNEIVK